MVTGPLDRIHGLSGFFWKATRSHDPNNEYSKSVYTSAESSTDSSSSSDSDDDPRDDGDDGDLDVGGDVGGSQMVGDRVFFTLSQIKGLQKLVKKHGHDWKLIKEKTFSDGQKLYGRAERKYHYMKRILAKRLGKLVKAVTEDEVGNHDATFFAFKGTIWSEEEKETVLKLRKAGMSNEDIANQLGNGRTVRAVRTRFQLLAMADRDGKALANKYYSTKDGGRTTRASNIVPGDGDGPSGGSSHRGDRDGPSSGSSHGLSDG